MSFGNIQPNASQTNSQIFLSFPNFVKFVNFLLPLSIFTCHFKNLAKLNSFCHLSYHPTICPIYQYLLSFLSTCKFPMSFGKIQPHGYPTNSHISLFFPIIVKKINIFLPLYIFTCHYKNIDQFHSFLSLGITSYHLPYVPVPPIFPLFL